MADRTQTSKDGTVIEEHDKGAFDAVSRATAIHGRHRGSFQQDVVINTTESKKYTPVYWIDADTAVVSTGDRITLNKDNIQDYKITGIKYVPVKVSASDFADFCSKYDVTKNGDTMQGGYSENNLSAYTDLVAAVDANTNRTGSARSAHPTPGTNTHCNARDACQSEQRRQFCRRVCSTSTANAAGSATPRAENSSSALD